MPDERSFRLAALVEGDRVSIPRPITYGRNLGGREIATFVRTYRPKKGKHKGELMAMVARKSGREIGVPYWRVKLFVDERHRREAREVEQLIEETRLDKRNN